MKKWGKVSVDCLFKDLAKKEWLEDVRKKVFLALSLFLHLFFLEGFQLKNDPYAKKTYFGVAYSGPSSIVKQI